MHPATVQNLGLQSTWKVGVLSFMQKYVIVNGNYSSEGTWAVPIQPKNPNLKLFENQPTKNIQEDKAGMRMTDCQIFW